jgi:hypothetical protein
LHMESRWRGRRRRTRGGGRGGLKLLTTLEIACQTRVVGVE